MGICPFHAERTPSFCVYPSSGSFYCFGCGAGGDVITFLRLIESWDYQETIKYLCDRVGMNFDISDEENELHKKKLRIYKINREVAKFYHNCLLDKIGQTARDYLKSRGVSAKVIRHFGLGYSPKNRHAVVDYLKKIGYNIEEIILSNLAFKTRSGKHIDRFCNRLMFPIIDVRGNVVAFGGRTLSGEMPKYVNTSDTLVFKKSNNLFALNFACKSLDKNMILTEGYMDVVALHQAGFQNAVATLGTSLTNSQIKLISRYAQEVVVSYDSDGPGKKASQRAIELLKNNGLKVKVICIPQGKDPDEFLKSQGKNGAIRFKTLIEGSKNDIEYNLDVLKSQCDLSTADGKVKYLTKGAEIISCCRSGIEREIYSMGISAEIGVQKSTVLIQVDKYIKQRLRKLKNEEFKEIAEKTSAFNDIVNKDKHSNLRASYAEESLIACIINDSDLAHTIIQNVSSELFVTEFNKRVFECIKDIISKHKIPDISIISKYEFSFKEIGRITKMSCNYNKNMSREECIREYIQTLKEEHQKKKFENVQNVSDVEIQEFIKNLNNGKKSN